MYREIVTKAVIGKGKVSNSGEVILNANNLVSKVLGCWIINHYYTSSYENEKIFAKGKYDIHVWYGYDNDKQTDIHKQTVDYIEEFQLNMNDGKKIEENNEYVIKCIKYPTCSSLSLNENGTISVKVDKELSLDVIGETKLKVQISSSCDEEWLDSNDFNNINVNYLNKD